MVCKVIKVLKYRVPYGHNSKICANYPNILKKNNDDNHVICIGTNLFWNAITVWYKFISVLVHKFQFTVSLFTVRKSPLINATDPKRHALQLAVVGNSKITTKCITGHCKNYTDIRLERVQFSLA
jgi:hypothetical protein